MAKEQVVTIDYATENAELYKQLNKRNQQYMYDFDRSLQEKNIALEKSDAIKFEMMTALIKSQKKGITARQMYGTVSQQVNNVLSNPKQDVSKPSPDFHLFVDGGLMIGSLFMIISGMTSQQRLGIVALLMNFLFAGLAMLIITKASPKYIGTTDVKNKRFLIRYAGSILLGMLIWMVGMATLQFIPEAINPVLDGTVYIVLGLVILALRFYIKKSWNIRGTMF